jgi:hypothetical protein
MASINVAANSILHIGDLITLKYQKYGGYMSGEGILINSVSLSTSIESFEDHLFEVCIQLQYSASNEYDEFMVDYNGNEFYFNILSFSLLIHLNFIIKN